MLPGNGCTRIPFTNTGIDGECQCSGTSCGQHENLPCMLSACTASATKIIVKIVKPQIKSAT